MTEQPEFSRKVRIDTLGGAPKPMSIEADEEERAALARRFRLVAIELLSADAVLTRSGDEIGAAGSLRARVIQSCAATDDPVEEKVEEEFRVVFRPHPEGVSEEEEIELGEEELDVIFYDENSVDIGEAVAETMFLGLNPYPRSPGADEALKKAGVKDEEEAGPFGALAALRDKLKP